MKHLRSIYILLLVLILSGCSVGIKTTIINKYPPLDSLLQSEAWKDFALGLIETKKNNFNKCMVY